jgi:hypothetical protein
VRRRARPEWGDANCKTAGATKRWRFSIGDTDTRSRVCARELKQPRARFYALIGGAGVRHMALIDQSFLGIFNRYPCIFPKPFFMRFFSAE